MEILTNLVAGRGADVGEERQGRVGAAAARVADGSFSLLCISTTNGGQISWVIGVTGEKLSIDVRGLPSLVYGYGDAYPITDRTQAGVWWAETMLPRATKARARVDLLKNIVKK